MYHSLEYQHYELLQICARSEADKLLSRVIHVAEQSVRKSGDSDAWFKDSILTDGVQYVTYCLLHFLALSYL